jgi:cytochrome c nitrite reductase small subunit
MPKDPRSSSWERCFEENLTAIVLLLLLILITGSLVGYRHYQYTREDPDFCKTCHIMQKAFTTWQMSRHRDVNCQECHKMSLLEQNRMLIAFVVQGASKSTKQKHGRIAPWQACSTCHLPEVENGALMLRNSNGHARHMFLLKIDCRKCHAGTLHDFKPNKHACPQCHGE